MTSARLSPQRAGCVVLLGIVLAVIWWLAGPATLGGRNTYMVTHGVSMEPGFHSGDLAIVRSADRYRVGDVAAYHSDTFKVLVLHRIAAMQDGHYTFKGDNNSWLDPEEPTRSQLIGTLVTRIPEGGLWLQRIVSPPALGLFAFLLLSGGGTAVERRRRRKRRLMQSHTPHIRVAASVATLTPSLRAAAAATAILSLVAAALGALAWTGPVRQATTTEQKSPQEMTFSYSTQVPLTAAYDGTTVSSPAPIFRKVAKTIDVRFSYRGVPGAVTTTAELSTAGGWHSSVPLEPATSFTGTSYDNTMQLNLDKIQATADAAAAVTGMPSGQVLITLAPTVTPETGKAFEPTLTLQLNPLQLSLAGGPSSLTVIQSGTTSSTVGAPRMLALFGRQLSVSAGRAISLALLILTLLASAAIGLVMARGRRLDEAALIHRRYHSLLVVVHPISTAPGRPLVDVTGFPTLVKLAERYGLLILTWTRSGIETFVVQDENTTYRYRTGTRTPVRVEPVVITPVSQLPD